MPRTATLTVDATLLVSNHAGAGSATVARGGVGSPHAEIAVFIRQHQSPVGGPSSSVAASHLIRWVHQAQQQQSVIQVTVDNGRAGALRLLDGETPASAVQLKREAVRAHPQRYTSQPFQRQSQPRKVAVAKWYGRLSVYQAGDSSGASCRQTLCLEVQLEHGAGMSVHLGIFDAWLGDAAEPAKRGASHEVAHTIQPSNTHYAPVVTVTDDSQLQALRAATITAFDELTCHAPKAAVAPPAREWQCGACTLCNHASATRCVICDALRGSSLAAAGVLRLQKQCGAGA